MSSQNLHTGVGDSRTYDAMFSRKRIQRMKRNPQIPGKGDDLSPVNWGPKIYFVENPQNGAVSANLDREGNHLPITAEVGGVELEFPREVRIGPMTEWLAKAYAERLPNVEIYGYAGAHVVKLNEQEAVDAEIVGVRAKLAELEAMRPETVQAPPVEEPGSPVVETSDIIQVVSTEPQGEVFTASSESPADEWVRLTKEYKNWDGPRTTSAAVTTKHRIAELAKELELD